MQECKHSTLVVALALMTAPAAWAPAAWAQDDIPTFTLNRDAFNAARTVESGSQTRQKLFADQSALWNGIFRDSNVDAAELAFLQSQVDGAPQVRLKGAATADWSPQDVVFNGNWSQTAGGGFDVPMIYLRARVAGWVAGKTSPAELAGKWPELTVSAPMLELFQRVPAASFPRDSDFARALATNLRARNPDSAERNRIIDALDSDSMILLVRSNAGGDPIAFANVWTQLGKIDLRSMRPDADLAALWTGEPAAVAKLAAPHSRSPEEAARVVNFLARQLAPVSAESLPANAWQPMRAFVVGARAAIRTLPAAEQPAARQLLHDAVKLAGEKMTPPPPTSLHTFALNE